MSLPADRRVDLQFDDNRLLPLLFGEHDRYLSRIEHQLGVTLTARGNILTISGPEGAVDSARAVLDSLWNRLRRGLPVGAGEVDASLRMARNTVDVNKRPAIVAAEAPDLVIKTKRLAISARSPTQAAYFQAMESSELVFGLGPAGTGKTYLAVAQAVSLLLSGQVDRIILSRPAVEAGERLGFLPGDLREKVDPYLRPIYDALYDMMPADQVVKRLTLGEIEIAPLAFMRGRTLSNSFVILDEAQNTTPTQMKMALTRLGEHSRMVVTGDVTQIDLPSGIRSGLKDALEILDGVSGVDIVRFTTADVVRHPLVARIVEAYDRRDRRDRQRVAHTPDNSTDR